MSRPGSVWSHVYLIPKGSESNVVRRLLEDHGFLRPNITSIDWMNAYTTPIQLSDGIASNTVPDDSKAWNVFSVLLENTSSVVVLAGGCTLYNEAFVKLLEMIPLSFFRDIPFCTGAFSNRIVAKVPFSLQVVPAGTPKSAWKSKNSEIVFLTEDRLLQTVPKYSRAEVKSALCLMNSCKISDINRQNLKLILQAMWKARYGDFIELKNAVNSVVDTFNEVCIELIQELTASFFIQHFTETDTIDIFDLAAFCSWDDPCLEWDKKISSAMIEATIQTLFTQEPDFISNALNKLLTEELNVLGLRMIRSLANGMNEDIFSRYVIDNNDKISVLVSLNQRLALYTSVWKQPYGVQCDVLKTVSKEYDSISNDNYYTELLLKVYGNSTEKLAYRIYQLYGNLAINTFFMWAESNSFSSKRDWKNVCKYEPVLSVKLLCKASKPEVFIDVILVLDSYDKSLRMITINTWEVLYKQFCVNGDRSAKEAFAQFLMPIILMSKERYPDELAEFTFKYVHKIMAENRMDYCTWEKLSTILPEVSPIHMWDRCRRLRKAAKRRNYNIDFS